MLEEAKARVQLPEAIFVKKVDDNIITSGIRKGTLMATWFFIMEII
jgi:hypothetical protein